MKSINAIIQQHLSLRLGLQILVIVCLVFGIFLSFVFYQTKQYAEQEAIKHANQVLDSTVYRISAIMDKTEAITASMEPIIFRHLEPDSLLAYSRLMLEKNPEVLGFTIAMEPDYFPERGRYFSAYSLREHDSITTVCENYEYFEKIWYKIPREKQKGCWLEPYIDEGTGVLTSSEYNYSFCKPMFNREGRIIGILCTDLLLKGMSQAVTEVKPYPNSSAIMLSHDGRYIVHPDTAKLVKHTIFSDPDPKAQQTVMHLGESMLAGHTGMQEMIVDGNEAYVFYRPLQRTGWSIAIVCPASDVFNKYYHVLYTVWTIISLSLLLLLVLCYLSIHRTIIPLDELAQQTKHIAEGNFDVPLPPSTRHDAVGQLQNSIILMQQSLHNNVSEIQQINAEMEQRNQELVKAHQLVREADHEKTAFVQDMSHQIRTPLNIINGFTQVLTADYHSIPEAELKDIMTRMRSSAKAISHITRMLIASSTDISKQTSEYTTFACNALCREAVSSVVLNHPDTVSIVMVSDVPDDFTIHTDREALLSILTELLDNANKFTDEGQITIGCQQTTGHVLFTVSDTGLGISSDDRDRIFQRFIKLDNFSEGIGLGLSLCQHTAKLLGGSITLDENYSKGSRFIITLPIT